jgi:hypothetical protein
MEDSKLDLLRAYLGRGWALVPLHDVGGVPGGVCTCRLGAACESAGKHPTAKGWQEPAQLVRDAATLQSVHAMHPRSNWGVATGAPSRLWVLDYDPAHADAATQGLVARLVGDGFMPHAATGGGGTHWFFGLPDGAEVRNAQRSRRLPAGLDVRGTGGQVVVAPSVSAKGAYRWLVALWGAEVGTRRAPGWLVEMVTAPAAEPQATATDGGPGGGSAVRPGAVPGDVTPYGVGYARAAVAALHDELASAPEGTRNDTAFRVGCRLVELANAPWSGLGYVEASSVYHSAGAACGLGYAELEQVFRHAVARVGDLAAVLPPTYLGGDVVSFGSAGQPAASAPTADEPALAAGGAGHTVAGQDPFEVAVSVEMHRMAARAEARRRLEAAGRDDAATLAAMREQLLTATQLKALPHLEPLVADLLMRDTLARVNGRSGHGKSFVTLDLAAHVGAGLPWTGRQTYRGDVVYMVAEGAAGAGVRVVAWETMHGREMTGVTFYPLPVQANAAEWDVFVSLMAEKRPALVVVDTQARVTVGVEENSAAEMGVVVDAMERLRHATGACVLLVHHRGQTGEHGRGSSAVKAAMQTELSCEKKGAEVVVSVDKQKDGPEVDPLVFTLTSVRAPAVVGDDGLSDGPGEVVGAALRFVGGRPAVHVVDDGELLDALGAAASLAREVFAGAAGGTKAEYRAVAMGERRVITSKATFYRAWSELLERRIVGKIRGTASWRYIPPEDRAGLMEPVQDDQANAGAYYAP